MFRFPERYFFRPSTNLAEMLPILAVVGLAVLASLLLVSFYYAYKKIELRSVDLHKFKILSRRYDLNRREQLFLMSLANYIRIPQKSKLLTNPETFEKTLHAIEHKGFFGKRFLKRNERLISYIRVKLFGREIQPDEKIRSTLQLRAGLRLFLRYLDFADTAAWAHLVDVDQEGLIVVVPEGRELKVPLRKETSLEITVYMPNHDPVTFNTVVKAVIPGPRRMVILEHSNHVITKNPQSPSIQKELTTFGPFTTPHRTPPRRAAMAL